MKSLALAAAVLTAIGLGIAAAAGAMGGGTYPPAGAPPAPHAAELRMLGRIALERATLAGDSHPTGGVVVPTTRDVAEAVDAGDSMEPNTSAYFVLLRGRFTLTDVSIPRGADPPKGTVLTLTINPRTNQNLGVGLTNQMPNLYAIGIPEPLPLPAGSG